MIHNVNADDLKNVGSWRFRGINYDDYGNCVREYRCTVCGNAITIVNSTEPPKKCFCCGSKLKGVILYE